jgi:hypothetical protein
MLQLSHPGAVADGGLPSVRPALPAPTTPTTPVLRGTTDLNNLPTLGDAARADLSPIIERKLGEEIMRDIRRDRDYLDDDPILEYLNNFGGALVAAPGRARRDQRRFFFFAVRDPMINAFALPGGFIGVHSGCCWRRRPNRNWPRCCRTRSATCRSATSRACSGSRSRMRCCRWRR